MSDNKPFGDCNVPGCHMGAMRGMITCGMHKSSGAPNAVKVTIPHGKSVAKSELMELDAGTLERIRKTVKVDYSAEFIRTDVEELLEGIRRAGYVVRVEQVPCEPLAMGNHRDVVTVYEVRK